jgi:hypothetical protein
MVGLRVRSGISDTPPGCHGTKPAAHLLRRSLSPSVPAAACIKPHRRQCWVIARASSRIACGRSKAAEPLQLGHNLSSHCLYLVLGFTAPAFCPSGLQRHFVLRGGGARAQRWQRPHAPTEHVEIDNSRLNREREDLAPNHARGTILAEIGVSSPKSAQVPGCAQAFHTICERITR